MSVSWTKEQEQVITLRDRNMLVSAAAGSGKTAVLVERIIQMLIDEDHPVDVDRLLVVTFTEAAASEMKERIRNAIEEQLIKHPENEHLKQQATLIHTAQITTIHSFCLSVIRDHFAAIQLDPGFRIAEEGELELLKRDTMGELLEKKYQEKDDRFLQFIASYGTGKTDKKIEELILQIYEYVRSYPDEKKYLEECVLEYQKETVDELRNSVFMTFIAENVPRYLKDIKGMIEEGLSLCQEPDGPYPYEEVIQSDLDWIDRWEMADGYEEAYEAANAISWKRMTAVRDKSVSEEKKERVKSIREQYKKLVKELVESYFSQSMEEMLHLLKQCAPMVEELKELVLSFAQLYQEKKNQKNMIDFSDMEHFALRILTDQGHRHASKIAKEYQKQFVEIMIDEYQDSNLIQETILKSISGIENGRFNLFMVGDVKQSIYRFRLSRPELFMEKYHQYSLEDGKEQRIDLHKNFRSREEVLESVNEVFHLIMKDSLGGITYDDSVALHVGASYEPCENMRTEALIMDAKVEENVQENYKPQELEARLIAMQIRKVVKTQKVTDQKTKQFRNASYRDIVILVRSMKGYADVFSKVLSEQGIPVCVSTREGYFATQEIGIVLDYLRILDNEKQDFPLTAVLLSPMVGLLDADLARIRMEFPTLPFCEATVQYMQEGTDERVRSTLTSCYETLQRLREKSRYISTSELIYEVVEETGYLDFVSAMTGGEQRRLNIEVLMEKAKAYENSGYTGLFQFVRYVEQLQKYSVDYGEASVEDEKSNTVRIMSIHKSKGLEFPIVFVSGMGKNFNMQSARGAVLINSEMGIGLDAVDLSARTKQTGPIKKMIQKKETLDSLAEELRVLYVAMTRAKEKLILTGTVPKLMETMQTYQRAQKVLRNRHGFSWLSKANTYWDWVLPAVINREEEIPVIVRSYSLEEIVKDEIENEISGMLDLAAQITFDVTDTYDENAKSEIEEQFSYQYPYKESKNHKLKFSVSELKHRKTDEDTSMDLANNTSKEDAIVPSFMEEKEAKLFGAAKGTAYHQLMENLDFSKQYSMKDLKEQIDAFVECEKLSEQEAQCIHRKQILRFLEGNLGKRMQKAAKNRCLFKEQPFVLGIPAQTIYEEEQEEEILLVQGIIDVFFEEEGELVLLDYKTDRISNSQELVQKYEKQLHYYSEALSRITGKRVKEIYIYSFTLEEEILLSDK